MLYIWSFLQACNDFTTAISSQAMCCFSLIFSKLCDHLAFAFHRPFTGSTKREKGISPQKKKAQLWPLKESRGLALSLPLHCYAKEQLGNKSERLASEEEPTSEGNMSLRPQRKESMLSLPLIFSFSSSLACSSSSTLIPHPSKAHSLFF